MHPFTSHESLSFLVVKTFNSISTGTSSFSHRPCHTPPPPLAITALQVTSVLLITIIFEKVKEFFTDVVE
jgi:hypothetical protein